MNIKDLRIIVTGAASGMGKHFALSLAAEGAWVMAADKDEKKLKTISEDTRKITGKLETVCVDVTSEQDVARMVDIAFKRWGYVNGLINNAGLFRDALLVKKDKETGQVRVMSLEDWKIVLDVDLTGPFLCTRAVVARMIESSVQPGVIVNMSSVSRYGNVGQSNYSAAKAGLAADTRVWAKEFARYGIRVGAVAPGYIQTPILDGMRKEVLEKMCASVALKRIGTPEEIYLGIKFIIECDYFTGRCIDIDGGFVL